MKILAFSGSHENPVVTSAFLERVRSLGEPPDIFVSAGDLGPKSMSTIFKTLTDLDRPILYVLGNHILHHPKIKDV
ncbi:MAG: metallophosphoesterase, partial [Theionarchaea archaeon]|nr:metallophosphoesterase [Theionarchaea archaeon]